MTDITRTDEGKNVPCEFTDTIDVGRHEGHNLSLASELILLFFLLSSLFARRWDCNLVLGIFCRTGRTSGRGRDVFSDECLCEENRVELDTKTDLEGRGRD